MTRYVMVAICCSVLAGCNTLAGVGQDITGIARWTHGSMTGQANFAPQNAGYSAPAYQTPAYSAPAYQAPAQNYGIPAL